MATPTFKDHFSRQSGDYSRYRPGYPPELIAWVASRAPDRALVVDCATGNGQAAIALAEHFDAVVAVDGSRAQLGRAQPHPGVRYELAVAEHLPVPDASVSLVAAAQAVHWFDFDRFHAECRRILKPDGAIAVWTYEKLQAGPAIDGVVDRFYEGVVGEYWPPERRSWSSVQRFKDAHAGQDPLPALGSELATLWPAGSTLRLNWPVHLRLGRA
jgi:ubiquinone/menaquinone biosynthesis C-methylase UbiE